MNALSYPMYQDFRDQNQVFSGMLCRFMTVVSAALAGHNERARANWFRARISRSWASGPRWAAFSPRKRTALAAEPVVVLGHDYWRTRFAGDPSIVGKEILVNDHKLTIVGVAQPGFQGIERLFPTQIYIPIMMAREMEDRKLDDRRRAGFRFSRA